MRILDGCDCLLHEGVNVCTGSSAQMQTRTVSAGFRHRQAVVMWCQALLVDLGVYLLGTESARNRPHVGCWETAPRSGAGG
ncbi:hypothetical protein ACLOJK_006760 [Asimina triloba]